MATLPEAQSFSLMFLVQLVKKYALYIAAVVAISCILAIILTLPAFYPPEYRSSLVVFAHSPERYDLDNPFGRQLGIYTYGDSKEAEKLINIAESEEFQLAVIDSLDLWSIYDIDPSSDGSPKFYVLENYRGNVSIKRVSGNGLEVSAYDTNPQLAADIVNTVVRLLNRFNRRMLQASRVSLGALLEQGERDLEMRISQMNDSARQTRQRYNILRSLTQSEVLAEQILIAQGELAEAQARSGAKSAAARAKQSRLESLTETGESMNLQSFQEGLDQVMALEEQLQSMSQELGVLRRRRQYLRTLGTAEYDTLVVPGQAIASDKKARPIRWVMLVGAFMVSLLVSLVGVILIDRMTQDKEPKVPVVDGKTA